MLKVESIQFTDSKERSYIILKQQIETFPLQGGEEAQMISTQVWNQHGTTHINALMESFQGELVFIIYTSNMRPADIAAARQSITNICNPLNGTLKMTVTLNDGSIFNRDITFSSAPSFPVGLDNRNQNWQKVQLFYTANNPFWYAENEIIESFQGSEPLFSFPFSMSPTNPVIFGNVIPSNVAINSGQVEAPVVIEIKGSCVNPKITNETTGEFIAFKDLTMNADQTLIIDTTFGSKKVELDQVNVFNKLDFNSTFFNLMIGENLIDFSDETGNPAATIHFIYKNLYVTI
jgi:Phage tail protein